MSTDAISYFRTKVSETTNQTTAESRRKAVNALVGFTEGEEVDFDAFSADFLNEWVVWLIQNGYSQKTAAFYIKQIATLYNRAVDDGLATASDEIAKARNRLLEFPEEAFVEIDDHIVDKLQAFFRANVEKLPSTRRLAMDVVKFAVLNGGITFDEIADFKKDDYRGDDSTLLDIVERYAKPKNKYLFPLNQSRRTRGQLRRDVGSLFFIALTPFGLRLSRTEELTAFDFRCLTALRCGVAPTKISGLCDEGRMPSFNPAMALLRQETVRDFERNCINNAIAKTLTDNPMNWYAMQLRPHVDFEEVKSEMKTCPDNVAFADVFYPHEEIVKRTGKRMTAKSSPVVAGLVFFRSHATDIAPMFRHIGNLAWCYRQTAEKSSPYAVIPSREMDVYQTAIGQFSEGMEVFPEGTLAIEENDCVVMLGGNFAGKPATVAEIKGSPESGGKTVVKLAFIGDNKIEWIVKADPRMVQKISRQKYDELLSAADEVLS